MDYCINLGKGITFFPKNLHFSGKVDIFAPKIRLISYLGLTGFDSG